MSRPVITSQPADVSAKVGDAVSFAVVATSDDGPLNYQWYVTQSVGAAAGPIGGATGPTLSATASTAATAYACVVTNASGSVATRNAALTLTGGGSGGTTITGGGYVSVGSGTVNFGTLASGLGTNGRDFYLDDNYSIAQPSGLPVPSFPFLDQNNTNAVVFRQPYEQAIVSYAALDMKQPLAGGLYYFGDANFRDGQAGVYVFDRMFGNIPAQRIRRGQSYSYAFQFILVSGASVTVGDTPGSIDSYQGPTYSVGTRVYPVNSTLIYDYFLDGHENDYPLRRAPSYELTGQIIDIKGEDFNDPSVFPLTLDSNGLVIGKSDVEQILAEDDRYDEYRGAIKCRVRRLIAAPTVASFRNSGT